MGSRNFRNVITKVKNKEQEDKRYWDRKKQSDDAISAVGAGLGARATFKGFDQDEFARNKRNEAFNKRSRRREMRENQERAREDYYRRQMRERRRENEMRKSKQEMGQVGTLGGRNPYGDDAIWNNETRSWERNTKVNNLAQWNAAKARSDANQRGTNLFGQAQGTSFAPGSSSRGTINQKPQVDNRDFKKLYEELLKIHNASKK